MNLRNQFSRELHTEIDLKTAENLLIIGLKADLEPFKAQYGDEIVYIEELSKSQLDALKVPTVLRNS